MKRTIMLVAAIAGVTALALTGCTGGGGSQKKTIVVQTDSYSLPGFKIAATEFEKQNPGVTVDFQVLTADQQSTTNLQVLNSSNAPDVASAPTNSSVYTAMVANKQFLPLDDVWKDAKLDQGYGPTLAKSLKPDGTPLTVLYSVVAYGVVWYNKDVFAKAGVTVPADHQIGTMDNLRGIATKLRAGGFQPLSVGGSSNYHLTWMLDNMLASSATPEELTNYTTSFDPKVKVTASYTDPAFTNTLDRLKQMYDDKIFQDGVLGMDGAAGLALFASGKAGMMMGHNLTPAALKDQSKVNLNLGFLFLPPINAGEKVLPNYYAGNTLEIPVKAKNPDLAKKFLTLLMSPAMQGAAIAATGGAAPAISLPASELQKGALAPELELFGYISKNGNALGWASLVPASLGTTDPMIQKLFLGDTTSQKIGDDLNTLLNKVRSGS